jgi:hypothetical protein
MAMRFLVFQIDHPLTAERFLIIISVIGKVDLRATARREGLSE